MQYEQAKDLCAGDFKRLFGVRPPKFDEMVKVMGQQQAKLKKPSTLP